MWNTVISWLNQPEEIDAEEQKFDGDTANSYEEAEMLRIEKRFGEIGKGRHNLINLLATAGDDLRDSALEETREKLRQLKEEEERLSERKVELQQQKKFKEQSIYQRSLLREALEYYLSKAPEEITFSDRRELIRYVVREIRVFENEVKVYGF